MSDEADPATAAAADVAAKYKEAADKVRDRAETTAKALAGLGTAGLTAVGIAKFSDIYPVPPDAGWAIAAVLAGFLAMVVAIVGFTLLLWDANRPIIANVDPSAMTTNAKEKEIIGEIYQRMADLNRVESLAAYQARAFRLQRIADRSPDTEATKLRATADRMRAEIQATQSKALLAVARHRVNRKLRGFRAGLLALGFVVGLYAFGLGADRLESERTSKVATLKACSEAIEAKVDAKKLSSICNDVRSTTPAAKPTPDQARATKVTALSTTYSSCIDTAVKEKTPAAMCDSIKEQIVAATK